MRAVRLHGQGVDTLVVEEVDTPRPASREALVEVRAAAITRNELEWPQDRLPAIPSYELAGVVDGEPVYALTPFDRDGVAAEFAAVPEELLVGKPRTLDDVQGAAVPLPALSAWQGLFDHGALAEGQRVLITGAAGGVGHFATHVQPLRHDGGLWGCDCAEHAGVHLFEDFSIVENVDADGLPVPVGEAGARLLVTNLFNHTQPLIRFKLGDMVTVDPQPCRCGRVLLRLRELEGRSEDVIRLGGVTVHPVQFAPLSSDPDVREFQVVQEGERLRIRLALRAGANGAATRLRAALAERLHEAGVAHPAIDIEVVERLDRPPGGKLALVVADRSPRGRASDRAAHEPGARAQRERAAG